MGSAGHMARTTAGTFVKLAETERYQGHRDFTWQDRGNEWDGERRLWTEYYGQN